MKNEKDQGAHYRFQYRGIKLDPARISLIYGITHPIQFGIVKKALRAGERGKKSLREDLKDIICACERWLEVLDEDEQFENQSLTNEDETHG